MPLPNAPLRAYPADMQPTLGGFAELAGVATEFDGIFLTREWKHPWVGLEVTLPNGRGKITKCLNHPRGHFLFDVDYPDPVPPISNGRIVLADNQAYYQMSHRFTACELDILVRAMEQEP